MKYFIVENNKFKLFRSKDVNYNFNKQSGSMYLWGKTIEENPEWCPNGPTIVDIEITTICNGINNKPCSFCYKSNTPNGKYMTFEQFKILFDKLPKTVTQIAFGVDAECISNHDIWKILHYTRDNGVIPNITVANLDEKTALYLAQVCGDVAVSNYGNTKILLNTINNLNKARNFNNQTVGVNYNLPITLKNINIHQMISKETFNEALYLIHLKKHTKEFDAVNAIIFLSLKQKGRGKSFNILPQEEFTKLIRLCLEYGISFGFDSCSAPKVIQAYKDLNEELPIDYIEPCESTRFSIYFNVEGKFFPCSFSEESFDGIKVTEDTDFIKDIWESETAVHFRNQLDYSKHLHGCEQCPLFEV